MTVTKATGRSSRSTAAVDGCELVFFLMSLTLDLRRVKSTDDASLARKHAKWFCAYSLPTQ